MKRKYVYLEYKYPESPWRVYDYTADPRWADLQFDRMKMDFPGAEYRKEARDTKAR